MTPSLTPTAIAEARAQVAGLLEALPGTHSNEIILDFPCEGQASFVWHDIPHAEIETRPDLHHFDGMDFKIVHDEGELDSPIWKLLLASPSTARLALAALDALAAAQAEQRQTDARLEALMAHHKTVSDRLEVVLVEREHFKNACIQQNHEIEQTLGRALKYPEMHTLPEIGGLPGDTDVQVFEHCAETLALEVAKQLAAAQERESRLREALGFIQDQARQYRSDMTGNPNAYVSRIVLRAESALAPQPAQEADA